MSQMTLQAYERGPNRDQKEFIQSATQNNNRNRKFADQTFNNQISTNSTTLCQNQGHYWQVVMPDPTEESNTKRPPISKQEQMIFNQNSKNYDLDLNQV